MLSEKLVVLRGPKDTQSPVSTAWIRVDGEARLMEKSVP